MAGSTWSVLKCTRLFDYLHEPSSLSRKEDANERITGKVNIKNKGEENAKCENYLHELIESYMHETEKGMGRKYTKNKLET